MQDAPRSGRPCKLTQAQKKKLTACVVGKQRKSTRHIASEIRHKAQFKIPPISYRTVGRILHQEQLHPYHRTRQTKLTEQHKQKRLHFVTAHKDTDWHAALFVDEKKFSRYVRPNSKNDITWAFSRDAVPGYDVLQRGPELMVWGGMSSVGVTPLHRIQGTLDSTKYISILNKTLLPASHQIFPS